MTDPTTTPTTTPGETGCNGSKFFGEAEIFEFEHCILRANTRGICIPCVKKDYKQFLTNQTEP